MPKTQDYTYEYHGYYTPGGICRVRLYEAEGQPPLFIVSELPGNENTSITNLCEYLAAELRQRHLLGRYDDPTFIWIEHYPREPVDVHAGLTESWALVHFSSYEITQSHHYSPRPRPKLGSPGWLHIDRGLVEQMINRYGERLDE